MRHQALLRKTATRYGAWALGAAVLAAAPFAIPLPAHAQVAVGVSITVGSPPPPLPVYDQPPIPDDGYIWVPGYWAWDGAEYYWVPGTWVEAPFTGALWTPAYWGWSDGVYVFHEGYWGPRVGFYGGIDYGYGYPGEGYEGGRWQHGGFYYNRSVNNISNVHVTNVYNQTVVNNVTVNRVSYNGGNGGVRAQPTAQEVSYAHEHHTPPVAAQQQHMSMARQNPALRATVNHGVPSIAATARPASFNGSGVVAAHGAAGPAGETQHAGPRAQPGGEQQGLRSERFAPHPNANPNGAREPGAPNRSVEMNRPEERAAPREPRPEASPLPHEEAMPREQAPREQAMPREAAPPREPAPREMAPPPAPREPAFHGAPPPQQAHPAAQPHPAPRPHPNENGDRRDEQHPPGG